MENYDAFIDDAKRADAQEEPPAEYEGGRLDFRGY